MAYRKREVFPGFIQADPIPLPDELKVYYEEEFYQSIKPDQLNDSSLEVRDNDSLFYNIQYSIFCELLNIQESACHVDLGCGYGHLLKFISRNSPNTELVGCEVYPEARGYVNQIPLASFEELNLDNLDAPPRSLDNADTLSLINVIEHLRDPSEFLRVCYSRMKTGSSLLIQVPNDFNPIQKAITEQLGLDEWWFCPPRHISYFTPEGISELTRSVGFKVVDMIATFPIDMLLLSGMNYRTEPELGRKAHFMRLNFELRYIRSNGIKKLIDFYRNLAAAELGREVVILLEK